MGLDSSGRWSSLSRFGRVDDGGVGHLFAARTALMETMERTKEVELYISKSGMRLQEIKEGLPALQAVMKPLEAQALVQRGLDAKIDKASEPAERVLQTFDVVQGLERTLRGEPRRDLGEYLASLSQLEEAIDYLSHNCAQAIQGMSDAVSFLAQSGTADNYRLYRLNERLASVYQDVQSNGGHSYDMGLLKIALGKLDLEFRRVLLENSLPVALPEKMPVVESRSSTRTTEDDGTEEPEPRPLILAPILSFAATDTLQTIVERLNYHNWTNNLLEIYKECRIVPITQSLQNLGANAYLRHSTPERIDRLSWTELEDMIELWCQHIEVACKILFKSERRLCTRVFSKVEKNKWIRCWGKLGTAGFLPFLVFGEAIALSKISPEKLFKLLDMYDVMEKCHHSILEMFEGGDPACGEIILRARELQKKVVFRASETLSSFTQMVQEDRSDVPRFGERSLFASYVMNYAGYMCSEYGPLLSKVLRIHKRMETGVESQEDLLAMRVQQMVAALEKRLVERSKAYADTSLGYIFLMNNCFYMISHVKKDNSKLLPLLGEQWHKDMLGKLRSNTLRYQRETWGKMLTFLNRDGLQSSSGSRGTSREIARQRLRSFTQAFDETCQKHANWTIPSEDLRGEVELAVTQMLIPAYRSYTETFRNLLEQGGVRHMKYTAEEIEQILEDIFQLRAHDSRPRNGTTAAERRQTVRGPDIRFTSKWLPVRRLLFACYCRAFDSDEPSDVYTPALEDHMDDDVWKYGLRYTTLKGQKDVQKEDPNLWHFQDSAKKSWWYEPKLYYPHGQFPRGWLTSIQEELEAW